MELIQTRSGPLVQAQCGPMERHWSAQSRPLPVQPIFTPRATAVGTPARVFHFTTRIQTVCEDVIRRCPELSHIHSRSVLYTFTPARNRSVYGLQARVTPMRFRDGALTRRYRGTIYQVQRYYVNGVEILYLVTFCLPRFLDQSFEEKLVTIFHELYHISPHFNGDLRRHGGRYDVHSKSKKAYDVEMGKLARHYLLNHPNPAMLDFLKYNSVELRRAFTTLRGVMVPRPKMFPIGFVMR